MEIALWTNGNFALPIIEQHAEKIDLIITDIDKKRNRGQKISPSSVKNKALEKGIKLIQIANIEEEQFIKQINQEKDRRTNYSIRRLSNS